MELLIEVERALLSFQALLSCDWRRYTLSSLYPREAAIQLNRASPFGGNGVGRVCRKGLKVIYPGLASWDYSDHLPMLPAFHLSLVPKFLSCLPPEVGGQRGVTSTHSGQSLSRITLRIVSISTEIMPQILYPVLFLTVLIPSPFLSWSGPIQTWCLKHP